MHAKLRKSCHVRAFVPVFNNHANFNPDEVETFWKMHSLFVT